MVKVGDTSVVTPLPSLGRVAVRVDWLAVPPVAGMPTNPATRLSGSRVSDLVTRLAMKASPLTDWDAPQVVACGKSALAVALDTWMSMAAPVASSFVMCTSIIVVVTVEE